MQPTSLDLEPEITRARTVADLKRMGTFREVKAIFQRRVGARLTVRARGWQDLLDAIQAAVRGLNPTPTSDAVFVSEAARVIFSLLSLHGDVQFELLGITVRHFGHRGLARAWRDRMARLIHPDRCDHPLAARAMAEVSEIYEDMTRLDDDAQSLADRPATIESDSSVGGGSV